MQCLNMQTGAATFAHFGIGSLSVALIPSVSEYGNAKVQANFGYSPFRWNPFSSDHTYRLVIPRSLFDVCTALFVAAASWLENSKTPGMDISSNGREVRKSSTCNTLGATRGLIFYHNRRIPRHLHVSHCKAVDLHISQTSLILRGRNFTRTQTWVNAIHFYNLYPIESFID